MRSLIVGATFEIKTHSQVEGSWRWIRQKPNLPEPVFSGNLYFLPSLSDSVVYTRNTHSQTPAFHGGKFTQVKQKLI